MGEYLSIIRRVWGSGVCRWCGRRRGTLFSYDGWGGFCDRSCAESYGAIPLDRSIPIEVPQC